MNPEPCTLNPRSLHPEPRTLNPNPKASPLDQSKKTAKKAPAVKGAKKAGAAQPSKKTVSKKNDEVRTVFLQLQTCLTQCIC